jgi:hypothetical protein
MDALVKSTSPGGRYQWRIYPWEVRMSLWIETPQLYDTAAGRALLDFKDTHWSLDAVEWLDDSRARITLRRYPGDHQPPSLEALVDCAAGRAEVGAEPVAGLDQLEAALARALRPRP